MGLAQAKSRRKIGTDPNNTKWARDTNTFGQKILRSQGWEPGQFLGAKEAAQAAHYTAANASFVRVSVKDDVLGLGFKQARDEKVTGMDAFQDMLARLNGKSESAMEKDRQARVTVQTTLYCNNKFGPMRFVKGGWLVGDQEQDTPTVQEDTGSSETSKEGQDADQTKSKKSKKRKVEEEGPLDPSSADEKARKRRRKEKRKAEKASRLPQKNDQESSNNDDTDVAQSETERKSKSKKKDPLTNDSGADDASSLKKKKEEKKDKSKSKKSKRRKTTDEPNGATSSCGQDSNAKQDRKKGGRRTEDSAASDSGTDTESSKRRKKKKKKQEKLDDTPGVSQETSSSTPSRTGSGTSTPILRGHHAVRAKWIASKRAATLDDAALNQIFMIKAPAS